MQNHDVLLNRPSPIREPRVPDTPHSPYDQTNPEYISAPIISLVPLARPVTHLMIPTKTFQPRDLRALFKLFKTDDTLYRVSSSWIYCILRPSIPHHHPPTIGIAPPPR
jgi:hypothetical protein